MERRMSASKPRRRIFLRVMSCELSKQSCKGEMQIHITQNVALKHLAYDRAVEIAEMMQAGPREFFIHPDTNA
jgi:hypothetical protein